MTREIIVIYWNIDVDDYLENDIYVINGWGFSEENNPLPITVTGILPEVNRVQVIAQQREDLCQAFPGREGIEKCGFQIQIYNASQLFEKVKKIQIIIGSNEKQVVDRTMDEMRQVCKNKLMQYHIDVQMILGKDLIIQGWWIDKCSETTFRIEDAKGRILDIESERLFREDVQKNMDVKDKNYKAGFNIRVELEKIHTSKVYLIFQDPIVYEKIEIAVKDMLFEISTQGKLWNALKPEKFEENWELIQKKGIKGFREHLKRIVNSQYSNYDAWIRDKRLTEDEIKYQMEKCQKFEYHPKISIVIPLYNTPLKYLKEMLKSITQQTYDNWQLCLADGSINKKCENWIQRKYGKDSRICYRHLEKNGGIAENTNQALKMADGDFIFLADHDDVIVQGAFYEIVKKLNEDPQIDILYTDEDKISMDGKFYFGPNMKSDFNLDLLRSVNYICHIFVVRKSIVDQIGEFRSEFDGAQDYDFILRCCEKTSKICHIPKVLYHWRAHPDSTAENPESKRYAYVKGRKAVQEHYKRLNISAKVEDTKYWGIYRSIFEVQGNPKVSILILNKDHKEDLEKCISSIMERTTYSNFEIIIAENNSEEKEIFQYYNELEREYENVKVVYWKGDFNFSAINNFAAQYATGEYYVLLNNDIEIITPEWLEEMLGYCQREDVGMVGVKLYYPDHSIQHAGVVLGMGGIAGHILCKADGNEPGYNGRLVTVQDISAVTAACAMIKKEVYEDVGGLDETFRVAFNDIDLCMKVREKNLLIVFTPYVEMYHYESKSRGLEDTPEKQMRFAGEIKHFQTKWEEVLKKGDPYYNPNLSLEEGDCSVRY